ncbi:MAG: hypothetical protein CMO04_16230 [Thalassospira sp.]|nr:hypothetical protein [Thalassospira sp.]
MSPQGLAVCFASLITLSYVALGAFLAVMRGTIRFVFFNVNAKCIEKMHYVSRGQFAACFRQNKSGSMAAVFCVY